jgi:prephenate dehydratase
VLSQGLKDSGAIASELAARTYGGEVLAAGIEDNAANFTRFFLIRAAAKIQTAETADKVSIAFIVANRPGTLVAALQRLAEHNTNLCKIESRPVQGRPWEYVFYVDYLVPNQAVNEKALEGLRTQCSVVKEFGRYKAAPGLT